MQEINKLIQEEKYDVALKKLLTLEKEYLLKVQCLYELKKYEELKIFFEQVSSQIEDDYFEILGFYILALIELDDFDNALNILNEELSMPYIQDNYEEVLNNLYDDVIAQKQTFLIESGVYNVKLDDEEIINVLENETDYDELFNLITRLEDINIRKYLSSMDIFLQADHSYILKTFIMELMIKQQISDVVLVKKGDFEYEYMPIANQFVFQDVNYIKTRKLLESHLEKNPSYFDMCMDILDMFVYIIYPNLIDIDEINYVAAMIEYYIYSLNSEDLTKDFEDFYQVKVENIINNIDYLIKQLEIEEKYVSSI